MERKVIRIVRVVSATLIIVESGAHGGDDVGTIKLPIRILKGVRFWVRVLQQGRACFPLAEIIGSKQRQCVAD